MDAPDSASASRRLTRPTVRPADVAEPDRRGSGAIEQIATIGLLYHQSRPAARALAEQVRAAVAPRVERAWALSAWDDRASAEMAGTDLLVCVGGDGTVLRGARLVIPRPVPILGVNMGQLGFLSELTPDRAVRGMHDLLDGAGRIERRAMLRAEVLLPDGSPAPGLLPQDALNDVAVGRSGGRPIYIHVRIDGVQMDIVRADGMVVSTATGSTGYNLSGGGPVLVPESTEMVLTPIAAHLAHVRPFVLPGETELTLRVESDARSLVSFDGQVDYPLSAGAIVRVWRSEHIARFVRFGPPSDFYRNLTQLLNAAHA